MKWRSLLVVTLLAVACRPPASQVAPNYGRCHEEAFERLANHAPYLSKEVISAGSGTVIVVRVSENTFDLARFLVNAENWIQWNPWISALARFGSEITCDVLDGSKFAECHDRKGTRRTLRLPGDQIGSQEFLNLISQDPAVRIRKAGFDVHFPGTESRAAHAKFAGTATELSDTNTLAISDLIFDSMAREVGSAIRDNAVRAYCKSQLLGAKHTVECWAMGPYDQQVKELSGTRSLLIAFVNTSCGGKLQSARGPSNAISLWL